MSVPLNAFADSLTKITVGTAWYAQPEQGGFYQAKATGLYKKHGLDVTIRDGGPNVNGTQLLMGGTTDFQMGYSLDTLQAVKQNVPLITVAAMMQKDPQTLVVHRGVGHGSLADLGGAPMMIPALGRVSYWPWLKAKYHYNDSQLRPYSYDFRKFATEPKAVQQGYITGDGYFLNKLHAKAKSILLADYGWTPYAATIDTRKSMMKKHPKIVQAFVDATTEGYRSYLKNPAPGNKEIHKRNPDMSDSLINYKIKQLRKYGIVDSGGARTYGIGTMSRKRWRRFFDQLVKVGVLPADLDYRSGYTLRFVDHPGSK